VLKLSLLFHAALFLIICVASALLWSGARASGSLDNLESFITSVGGFGNCEPIPGAASAPSSTIPTPTTGVGGEDESQFDPSDATTSEPAVTDDTRAESIDDDEDCRTGERLVGEFRFEDARIFQAFAFGGVVLVLAGAGGTVVLVLLFNLMSDLTGGVRVTVLEEEGTPRAGAPSGSPEKRRRD
jgi:hypothetical protein